MQRLSFFVVGWCCLTAAAQAADSVLEVPGPNRADEPFRKEFSLAAAADFLDASSADWWQSRQCFTCHTNYCYLLARPGLKRPLPDEPMYANSWKTLSKCVG